MTTTTPASTMWKGSAGRYFPEAGKDRSEAWLGDRGRSGNRDEPTGPQPRRLLPQSLLRACQEEPSSYPRGSGRGGLRLLHPQERLPDALLLDAPVAPGPPPLRRPREPAAGRRCQGLETLAEEAAPTRNKRDYSRTLPSDSQTPSTTSPPPPRAKGTRRRRLPDLHWRRRREEGRRRLIWPPRRLTPRRLSFRARIVAT